jgi:hypothetical protein
LEYDSGPPLPSASQRGKGRWTDGRSADAEYSSADKGRRDERTYVEGPETNCDHRKRFAIPRWDFGVIVQAFGAIYPEAAEAPRRIASDRTGATWLSKCSTAPCVI